MLVCYCIQNENKKKTYVGATNNFDKRIRQHNSIISGGAKSTKGHIWFPLIHIIGFDDRKSLLQFEWQWKHCLKSKLKGLYRRIEMLEYILQDKKWEKLIILTSSDIACFIDCLQLIDEIILPN